MIDSPCQAMAQPTIQQAFDAASRLHLAGRLQEAEQLYRRILAQQPDHAQAMHLLGVIAHQSGRNDIAADLIRRAIALQPHFPEAYNNLGNTLKDDRRREEAIAAYRTAIALNPAYARAWYNLGVSLKDDGNLDGAIAAYRQSIALASSFPEAFNNLGIALREKERFDEAIAAYRHALALRPGYAEACNNLGDVLMETGQIDEALVALRQAIALNPNFAQAYNNLGNALREIGQVDQALADYQKAIAIKPDYADAQINLGNALQDKGQANEAIAAYRKAIDLAPKSPNAYYNLGISLHYNGQIDEAIAACRKAIELKPCFPEAYSHLGNVLKDGGWLSESIAAYRQAIALKPSFVDAHSNLVYTLHFHPDYDASQIAEEHRRWNRLHAQPLRDSKLEFPNDANPDRRIRIGYVSPDFRDHPVGRFFMPLMNGHDRSQFEIFCYSDVLRCDSITEKMRSQADGWRNICGAKDEAAAEMIRQDKIDILVDLTMHMNRNRLLVFARKPAPVQVTYLAYCSTTGLDAIDYRLTDSHLDPPAASLVEPPGDSADSYSEQSIRLPEVYWCYDPGPAAPPVAPLPALTAGHITFGCLNNFAKASDAALSTWIQLLRELPSCRFLLHARPGAHRQRTLDRLQAQGVDPARLTFVDFLATPDYLRLYHQIDIGLDPFPYAGGTTTCDALWMGVPVITLAGRTAVGRSGVTLLASVGLNEWVAESREDYVRRAMDLAADLPRLAALRAGLRERMLRSPLTDAPRFARGVEAAYRLMWRKWCESSRDNASKDGGRLDEPVASCQQAVALKPDYANAHITLGNALLDKGRIDDAIAAYRQAIAAHPALPNAHYNLGIALNRKGQLDEAIAAYRNEIAISPRFSEAYSNLGNALRDQGKLDEATAACRRAILLKPQLVGAHNNLANALRDQGLLDEAIASYRRAIALRPSYVEAYSNLGATLNDRGLLDQAKACYSQALAIDPACAEAHHNFALALLAEADFGRGWEEYEWRWKSKDFPSLKRDFVQPQWDGRPLNGQTILLHAEQGLGDTLQFARYVPMVARMGGQVVFACQPGLQRLLGALPGECRILMPDEPLPRFDLHCPLLSLPRLLGTTTLATIPAPVPYLHANAQAAGNWRARLAEHSGFAAIGIAWAGSPSNRNDRNRSMKLATLAPLAQSPGLRFVSLQKGEAAGEAKSPPAGMTLLDYTAELNDFADTAALIANLDLIITVDTAVAHLAGAMGKPVWTLLPHVPDWRWLLHREDTPWYPTMRLFRQSSRGDWDGVIARVTAALSARLRQRLDGANPAGASPSRDSSA